MINSENTTHIILKEIVLITQNFSFENFLLCVRFFLNRLPSHIRCVSAIRAESGDSDTMPGFSLVYRLWRTPLPPSSVDRTKLTCTINIYPPQGTQSRQARPLFRVKAVD